eukprot:583562_1
MFGPILTQLKTQKFMANVQVLNIQDKDALTQVEETKEPLIVKNSDQTSQTSILIDGKIKNVYNVDVVGQTFSVRMHLYLTWKLNPAEIEQYQKDRANFGPEIDFEVLNLQSFEQFEIIKSEGERYNVRYNDERTEYTVRCKYQIIMTCSEQFRLSSFPFDCQDLPIYLRLRKDISQQKFAPLISNKGDAFFFVHKANICFEEYQLMGAIAEFNESNPIKSRSNKTYSQFIFRMKVMRNPWFHLLQYFSVIFALSLVSFAVFFIESEAFPDRLGVLITLMLTYVAERFHISLTSPNVQYLTLMDKFLLLNFLFLVLFTILCVVYDGDDDNEMLIVLAAVYIVLYVLYIGYCIYSRFKQKSKLTMTTKELLRAFNIKAYDETMEVSKEDTNYREEGKIFRSDLTL